MAPDFVLLGLSGESFGPLNILPTTYPPISDAMQPKSKINKIIFN